MSGRKDARATAFNEPAMAQPTAAVVEEESMQRFCGARTQRNWSSGTTVFRTGLERKKTLFLKRRKKSSTRCWLEESEMRRRVRRKTTTTFIYLSRQHQADKQLIQGLNLSRSDLGYATKCALASWLGELEKWFGMMKVVGENDNGCFSTDSCD